MPVKFGNNATSTLAASINTAVTSISVQAGDASKFPTPGAGEWFPLTVVDGAGNMEIMRCTARVGSTLTVTRAQEGTIAKAFASGARAELRITAAALADFQTQLDAKANLSGAVFAGDVAIANNAYIRGAGNRALYFQTALNVTRGLIYHDHGSNILRLEVSNTSGVFQHGLNLGEDGKAVWTGVNMRIGGFATSSELHFWTSDPTDSYRIVGNDGGGLFIQRSTDRFASNATSLLSWSAANEATFPSNVYCVSIITNSNGASNNIKLGDDAWIGDMNAANTVRIMGQTAPAAGWLRFGNMANGFGVDAGSPDIIRYSGWSLQTDGNQYLPWAGLFMHQVFELKAGFYSGSSRDETNLPVGHSILVATSNGYDRNAAVTLYLRNTGDYAPSGPGAQLSGTWRAQGGFTGAGLKFQRTS